MCPAVSDYCSCLLVNFYTGGWNLYILFGLLNIFYAILLLYAILPFFYGYISFCWCIGAYYILWILINPLKVNIYSNIFPIYHFFIQLMEVLAILKYFLLWNVFSFMFCLQIEFYSEIFHIHQNKNFKIWKVLIINFKDMKAVFLEDKIMGLSQYFVYI